MFGEKGNNLKAGITDVFPYKIHYFRPFVDFDGEMISYRILDFLLSSN